MGWLDRQIRRSVLEKLGGLQGGTLTIVDPLGETTVGDDASGLRARIEIQSLSVYRKIAWDGANGAGESYLDGEWSTPDLAAVMGLFSRNASLAGGLGGHWLFRTADWWRRLARRNTLLQSRRNIAAHYDLSNDFFSLFLDPTMAYSAGVFDAQSGGSMEGASLSKFQRVCDSLELSETNHLLEIGGGWGGLAIYAAKNIGCRVTTTTISQEQFRYMKQAVAEQGLEDRITVLCEDYRDLRGEYDKIVSIEMIEAVGHEYFSVFFQRCQQLLRPNGLMLLQAILIPDQRYARYKRSQDFIQRHIFPGGCLPSLGALCDAASQTSELKLIQMQDWADHYARTLQLWRERFHERLDEVRALGMDDRFIRAWEYYFCYCEGGFRERQLLLTQLVFAAPAWRGNMALAEPQPTAVGIRSTDATDATDASDASGSPRPQGSGETRPTLEGAWA